MTRATIASASVSVALIGTAAWYGLTSTKKETPPLRIITASLPNAVCGQPYRGVIEATGGKKPYQWTITGLPDWILVSSQGNQVVLSGTAPPPLADGTCDGQQQLAQLRRSLESSP